MQRTVLLTLFSVVCGFQLAIGQAVMEPADQPVSLTGAIQEIHAYGPPGYGEDKKTDPPVTYLAIELPKPINIPCTPERPEWKSTDCAATKRLRLFFFPSSDVAERQLEAKARGLTGKKVTITGMLERQTTAGQYTPVILNVTAINAAAN